MQSVRAPHILSVTVAWKLRRRQRAPYGELEVLEDGPTTLSHQLLTVDLMMSVMFDHYRSDTVINESAMFDLICKLVNHLFASVLAVIFFVASRCVHSSEYRQHLTHTKVCIF